MTAFANSFSVLHDVLSGTAGVAVTYARGNNTASITAVPGITPFVYEDNQGAIIRTQSRDFIIKASALVLNNSATLPATGDIITEVRDGKTYTYTVAAPNGEAPWRFSDPQRQSVRIHTSLKGVS